MGRLMACVLGMKDTVQPLLFPRGSGHSSPNLAGSGAATAVFPWPGWAGAAATHCPRTRADLQQKLSSRVCRKWGKMGVGVGYGTGGRGQAQAAGIGSEGQGAGGQGQGIIWQGMQVGRTRGRGLTNLR